MKTLLVVTTLPEDHKRYRRFVKLMKRNGNEVYQVDHGIWFVKSDRRPIELARRLDGMLDSEKENDGVRQTVIVTTLLCDPDHLNGWSHDAAWKFVGMR